MVKIEDYNESFIRVSGTLDENYKIKKYFTYKDKNLKFSKKYKQGLIGDTVTFYRRNLLPKGLYKDLIDFLDRSNIKYEDNISFMSNFIYIDYEKYIPQEMELYDHQQEIIETVIEKKRSVFESATSSGKSLSIYIISRLLVENGLKVILVVPNIMLVNQMYKDFKQYGHVNDVVKINSQEKHKDKEQAIKESSIVIITKKSLSIYFDVIEKYCDALLVDECLTGNSNITMANGKTKKIKDCKVGEKVISYNIDKKVFEIDTIEKVYKNISSQDIYKIELENGEVIEITGNHKVLTKNRGWVESKDLTLEDDIISY